MHQLTLKLRPMAAIFAAFVLLLGLAACGGGEEAAAPADDAPATTPADDAPADAAADYEPGNEAVAALRTGSASVSGTVTYDGEVPTLPAIQMAADPACQAKHSEPVYPDTLELGDGNTMAHIFVSVKGMDGESYTAPSEPAVIDQQGCRYHPHVMGIMAGQPLVFLNSDDLLHNVHGLPEENREFNVGMPATRLQAEVTGLNTPEPLFPVKCDVHPWMQSYVAVMTHPYFDVTETDGGYEIDGLPPGTYEIEAWHERLGTQTQTVTVADGESASADFTFTR